MMVLELAALPPWCVSCLQ